MTTVSLRFDDKMKKELDELCEELGMNLTTKAEDIYRALIDHIQSINKKEAPCFA